MRLEKEDDAMVGVRILIMDECMYLYDNGDLRLSDKKNAFSASEKPLNSFKGYAYYYSVILCVVCIILMTGCVGNMPSTLEVAAQMTKTVYNKCSDLDNWQCLWYD